MRASPAPATLLPSYTAAQDSIALGGTPRGTACTRFRMWLSRCASLRARQRGKWGRGLSSRCAARGAARGGAAARVRPPAPAASGWPRTAPPACAARAARGLNRMRTHRVVCHALQNISWQTSFYPLYSHLPLPTFFFCSAALHIKNKYLRQVEVGRDHPKANAVGAYSSESSWRTHTAAAAAGRGGGGAPNAAPAACCRTGTRPQPKRHAALEGRDRLGKG